MPATLRHILINFDRIESGDSAEVRELLRRAQGEVLSSHADGEFANGEREHLVWERLIELADAAKVGDKLPGTVGRAYAKAYGEIKARPPRGARQEIPLTSAAVRAIEAYRKPSDQLRIESEQLVFTNRRGTVKAIEALIKRSLNDIEHTASESAAMRSSLKALLSKVDVG